MSWTCFSAWFNQADDLWEGGTAILRLLILLMVLQLFINLPPPVTWSFSRGIKLLLSWILVKYESGPHVYPFLIAFSLLLHFWAYLKSPSSLQDSSLDLDNSKIQHVESPENVLGWKKMTESLESDYFDELRYINYVTKHCVFRWKTPSKELFTYFESFRPSEMTILLITSSQVFKLTDNPKLTRLREVSDLPLKIAAMAIFLCKLNFFVVPLRLKWNCCLSGGF